MFIDYKKYNLPIEDIEMNEEENILYIKTSLYKYKFRANGDCCSYSYFKEYQGQPFSFIKGKIIKGVKEVLEDFEYEDGEDNDDEYYYTKPHLYQMTFKDTDEIFKFLLINISNGYYDGWLSTEIVI